MLRLKQTVFFLVSNFDDDRVEMEADSLVEPRVRLPVGGTETKSCIECS